MNSGSLITFSHIDQKILEIDNSLWCELKLGETAMLLLKMLQFLFKFSKIRRKEMSLRYRIKINVILLYSPLVFWSLSIANLGDK